MKKQIIKKQFSKKYILVILLLFILFLLYYYYYCYEKKEHYLTYFLPYNENNEEVLDLYNFYSQNTNESYYFKTKIDYFKIKVGIISQHTLSDYMLKIFLENTNLLNAETVIFKNGIASIDSLLANDINMLITDYVTIYYYKYVLNKDISNLKLVNHLNKIYFYTFVIKDSQITSLNNFPINSIIGILSNQNVLHIYIDKLLKDLKYEKDIDYTVKVFENKELLFDNLVNKKINIIICFDIYPSDEINKIMNKHLYSDILLLPFDINNEKVFLQKNSFINTDYIDLHKFSTGYLPKIFGKHRYTSRLPYIKMIYINRILITNKSLENEYTYNFIKYYAENLPYINYKFKNTGYELDVNFFNNSLMIKYHQGVIRFLTEKGYISNIDNENCKYLVGVMECNEKNLKANNLFYT